MSAGPYDDGESSYEVRLERVPGGLRLAEWDGTGLRRRAPVVAAEDVANLVERAAEVLDARDAARLTQALAPQSQAPGAAAAPGEAADAEGTAVATLGVSRGRSGDFKEELRLESIGDGRVRLGRWILRPGSGWQLQEAPPMLPAQRYAEVMADAVRHGLPARLSGSEDAARL